MTNAINAINRRKFLTTGTAAAAAATAAPAFAGKAKYEWRMITTWPTKDFPGLGTGASMLARYITELSEGQLRVQVFSGGEVVPPFETFDAVSKGTAEMGHSAAYYWHERNPIFQFFTAVPFGLTAQEMNGWIYRGGGQQLWDDVYAPHNLKPFLAGNTGAQMGGWFNREINKLSDWQRLKMRMTGLGAKVISRVGAEPVLLPGADIFAALQSGTIEAAKWSGPYNDYALGFYKAAKFYYYPGWHEPNAAGELMVNKRAYDALPKELQEVIEVACQAITADITAEFTERNGALLDVLRKKHKVELRQFPDDVLRQLRLVSEKVVGEIAEANDTSRRVYESWSAYRQQVSEWTAVAEAPLTTARTL